MMKQLLLACLLTGYSINTFAFYEQTITGNSFSTSMRNENNEQKLAYLFGYLRGAQDALYLASLTHITDHNAEQFGKLTNDTIIGCIDDTISKRPEHGNDNILALIMYCMDKYGSIKINHTFTS